VCSHSLSDVKQASQEADIEIVNAWRNSSVCAEGIDKCPGPSSCIAINGIYYCVCHKGWEKVSEFQCLDINECSRGIHGCDPNSTCVNTPGSWKCVCNKGWYPVPKDARLPACKPASIPWDRTTVFACVVGEIVDLIIALTSTNVLKDHIAVHQIHDVLIRQVGRLQDSS